MTISQDIESRINIVELVSKYVPLKKAGSSFKACCPFHNEKTPSFIVSPAKNIAYCYACHKGGGPIRFLMEIEKIEFRDALRSLAKEAGVELKSDFGKDYERRSDVYEIYKLVAAAYHTELFLPENQEKLAYAKSRGLTDETLTKFQIGYSGNPRELFSRLKSKGISEKDLMDSGIFVSPGRDKFFGRLLFPIANFTGHVVAFTGRIIDSGEPKYLNSPASDIFNKSSILYALHLAKNEIGKRGYAIVVEGQMDTVSLHQAGYTNVVGISGTALTQEHVALLKRLTKKIYLCLDSDDAGTKATFASIESMLGEDVDVRIIRVPSGKDPDEFIKSGGKFDEIIENAFSIVDFFIAEGGKKYDLSGAVGKTALIRDLLKFIRRVPNRIEADMFLRETARAMNVSLETLYAEYRGSRTEHRNEPKIEKKRFDIGEILSAYLTLYDFYDLFSNNFPYTSEHCREIPSFSVLERILQSKDITAAGIDVDRHMAVEFLVESENETLPPAAIEKKFLELISGVAKTAFEKEKTELSEKFDPGSQEYLSAYQALIEKGKRMGIKPNRA